MIFKNENEKNAFRKHIYKTLFQPAKIDSEILDVLENNNIEINDFITTEVENFINKILKIE